MRGINVSVLYVPAQSVQNAMQLTYDIEWHIALNCGLDFMLIVVAQFQPCQ